MLGFVLFLFLVVESEQACSTKNNFPKMMMMMMHDTCCSCFFSSSRAPLTNYAEEAIAVFVAAAKSCCRLPAIAKVMNTRRKSCCLIFADTPKVPSFLAGVLGMVPYF
jgi:hypothetical protein